MVKTFVAFALAAALIPAAASATDFTINWTSGVYNPSGPVRTVPGAYTDTYAFTLAAPGDFSGSLTTQQLSLNGTVVSDLDFSSVFLDKTSGGAFARVNFTVPTGGSDTVETVNLNSQALSIGSYLLTVNYNVNPASAINGASYGGTLNLAAAASPTPEPATWAMFLVGFAAVGGSIRAKRRSLAIA